MGESYKFTAKLIPMGKPRMTRRDKWAKRPCVLRYRDTCNELRSQAGNYPERPVSVNWVAYLPLPRTWSKSKKITFSGAPHEQTPDLDNICKFLFDGLFVKDECISSCTMSKFWDDGKGPRVEIEIISNW